MTCRTGLRQAVASARTPSAQLRSVVRTHVLSHIERQDEAFVSHSELRSLAPANRRRIVAKRDRYENSMRDLLAAGVEAGEFEIADIGLTAIAILMMCSGGVRLVHPAGDGSSRTRSRTTTQTWCFAWSARR
jgi:hypothetical protein